MKSLVGIFSLVVGVGVIGAPVASFASQKSQRAKRSVIVDGSENIASLEGRVIGTRNSQSNETFEGMGTKIENDYKTKNESQKGLPGKSSLESIINPLKSISRDGRLIESAGKSCQKPAQTMETFCGFVRFMNEDIEYKLKVAVDNNGKGKIKIVKKSSQKVEYYDNSYTSGRNSINSNFDQLSDFYKDTNDLWKFSQDAIIFP